MNDLTFDYDHQLDKLRIFKKEVDDAIRKQASKKYTIILADLFNITLDPLLIGGEYEWTMLQDIYREPGLSIKEVKAKVFNLLQMLDTHTVEIVNEFVASPEYATIQNKWEGYITIDGTDMLYKNPWNKVTKHDLQMSVKVYITMIGEMFHIKPASLGLWSV